MTSRGRQIHLLQTTEPSKQLTKYVQPNSKFVFKGISTNIRIAERTHPQFVCCQYNVLQNIGRKVRYHLPPTLAHAVLNTNSNEC